MLVLTIRISVRDVDREMRPSRAQIKHILRIRRKFSTKQRILPLAIHNHKGEMASLLTRPLRIIRRLEVLFITMRLIAAAILNIPLVPSRPDRAGEGRPVEGHVRMIGVIWVVVLRTLVETHAERYVVRTAMMWSSTSGMGFFGISRL